MTTFATACQIEYGQSPPFVPGMAYVSTPTGVQGYTGATSVGAPVQIPIKLDFSPTGASVGIAFNTILSVAGAFDTPFAVAVGSTVLATTIPLPLSQSSAGQQATLNIKGPVTETWTRVK